jgi:hypothetical protein
VWLFLYLQVLDFMTTLVGLKYGLSEGSPFVRWLMAWGPEAGAMASKVVAVVLALLCLRLRRRHLIGWINWWYGGLVLWNLALIWRAPGG